MPKKGVSEDLRNSILHYLEEAKKKEKDNKSEVFGPSTISANIGVDESSVLETCYNLQEEGRIEEVAVRTKYGIFFGYRAKVFPATPALNVSKESVIEENIRLTHNAYSEME